MRKVVPDAPGAGELLNARSPAAAASPCWKSLGPGRDRLLPTCDVQTTRSPPTVRDEMPKPRMEAFHATFSELRQVTGSPFSSETPVDAGPRQFGQFSP